MGVGRQPRPVPRNGAPTSPKVFGTSYMRTQSVRNNNQILHGIKTRCEENFYTINNEC